MLDIKASNTVIVQSPQDISENVSIKDELLFLFLGFELWGLYHVLSESLENKAG